MLASGVILQQILLLRNKDALDDDISDELIPFSDLKPRLNNSIFLLGQREWDEYPQNKLHKILPN